MHISKGSDNLTQKLFYHKMYANAKETHMISKNLQRNEIKAKVCEALKAGIQLVFFSRGGKSGVTGVCFDLSFNGLVNTI